MKKKGNESMKISPLFHSTYAKVKELLEANKPIRDGDWNSVEVCVPADKHSTQCVPSPHPGL